MSFMVTVLPLQGMILFQTNEGIVIATLGL